MSHFRPLDRETRPVVGENLAHHTLTVSLTTVSGGVEEHEVTVYEAIRSALRLDNHEGFTITAIDGVFETDMPHRFDRELAASLRVHASAVQVHDRTRGINA